MNRPTHRFVCFLSYLLTLTSAQAQVSRFEGKSIVAIQYSPPSTLDPSDLARLQPLKPGDLVKREEVAAAIDGLFSSGLFTDVAVEAEPSENGVIIRFLTVPQWFVGGVEAKGKISAPPSRAQMQTTAQFTLGAPFKDLDVESAVESMTRLLKSNGLYEAKISPYVERDPEGDQVSITFNIKDGKRAKYQAPLVEGNKILSDSTVLKATGWRLPVVHWWHNVTEARTRSGVIGVQNKYEKLDRLTAKVDLTKLDYDPATRRVLPSLTVTPGPKVKVTALEAKVSKGILKRYVPVFEERTVDSDLLVEGRRNLQDYFQGQGYYDVDVDFRILPPQDDLETIQYVIAKGERHKVAAVAVTGNKYFDTAIIRERMFITPASLTVRHGRYSEAFRRKDEANISDLYRSNGFRDVKVAIAIDDNYKPAAKANLGTWA